MSHGKNRRNKVRRQRKRWVRDMVANQRAIMDDPLEVISLYPTDNPDEPLVVVSEIVERADYIRNAKRMGYNV